LPPGRENTDSSARAAIRGSELEKVKDMAVTDAGVPGSCLGGALLWGRLPRWSAATVGVGILILTLADLWNVDHRPAEYHPRGGDPKMLQSTEAVEFLRQDPGPYRILPLTGEGRNNNRFAFYRISSILGYHPAKLKIVQDVIDEEGPVGISKTLSSGNFNVVNILNMKYVVATRRSRPT
jgi:hypothetical protein